MRELTDTHTDSSDSITSTADAGGNMEFYIFEIMTFSRCINLAVLVVKRRIFAAHASYTLSHNFISNLCPKHKDETVHPETTLLILT